MTSIFVGGAGASGPTTAIATEAPESPVRAQLLTDDRIPFPF